MERFILMTRTFVLVALWFTPLVFACADDAVRPNVLMIATDDMNDWIGCFGGHADVKTPNIDRLAKRGLRFNKAYCQQAVCNPSRASVMTGRRIDTLQVWDLPTHFRTHFPDIVTLPQHFKNNGYFTQNIGKIFHNWIHELQGDPESWSVPAVMHFANHNADKAIVDGPLPPSSSRDPKCECRDVPDDAYFDGRVASLAIDSLRLRKEKSEPFFLAVGFWKPHSPFNAPKRYWDLYVREKISLPEPAEWPQDAPRIAWHDSREILGSGPSQRKLTDDAIREIRHGYLANISYMDSQLGRVIDELDRLGLADNTVIVFWSDHGYHLGEHTLFAKTSNFELDARVPVIIATPKMKTAGQTTESLAELMDLYLTLADVCKLPQPVGIEGVSLAPILTEPTATVREVALTQHARPPYFDREPSKSPTHMGYSIRSETHRYTEWRDWKTGEATARELYDHRIDTDETRNLANEPDEAAELNRHSTLLKKMKPAVSPGWKPALPRN